MKRGEGVEMWKLEIELKTHAFNETGFFRVVSQLLLSMIVGVEWGLCQTIVSSTNYGQTETNFEHSY